MNVFRLALNYAAPKLSDVCRYLLPVVIVNLLIFLFQVDFMVNISGIIKILHDK